MKIEFDRAKWWQDSEGFWISLKVKIPAPARKFVEGMKEKLYDAELKIHRERRSLDANAYLWVLCQKIAEVVRNVTKEDVYRDAVKHAGVFDFFSFSDEAAETFIHRWCGHGLGWFAEPVKSFGGRTQVMVYYGSSVYDSKEMSVLLEYVANQAKDLEIETATPEELERMKSLWDQN